MAVFKDPDGNSWTIEVNYSKHKRFKREVGFNIFKIVEKDDDSLASLLGDLERLFACVWICIEKQCDERGVTEDEFGELLRGDSLEEACNAFLDACIDFFPNPNQRKAIRSLLRKMKDAGNKMWGIQAEAFDALDIDGVTLTQKSSS